MIGHNLATRTDATLNLQAGTVNTIAIVPNTTADGFRLSTSRAADAADRDTTGAGMIGPTAHREARPR
jgi:hypothetical protein